MRAVTRLTRLSGPTIGDLIAAGHVANNLWCPIFLAELRGRRALVEATPHASGDAARVGGSCSLRLAGIGKYSGKKSGRRRSGWGYPGSVAPLRFSKNLRNPGIGGGSGLQGGT